MSDQPQGASWSLPPALALRVDRACNDFEAAWKSADPGSPRPSIEEHLGDTPEPARSVLLRELMVLELTYRRREGDSPGPEEYQQRFPGLTELIGEVYRQVVSAGSSPALPATVDGDVVLPSESANAELPTLPGYEILGEVDRGGMGVVYKARHLKLNALVALKMIRAGDLASPQELARFRLEIEAVTHLCHPNIVRIYDCGGFKIGRPYFAMEFVNGGSLAGKKLSGRQAAELVETLARAMQVVHDQGILHRDLKPANVLLTAQGVPKITDFGLAKLLNEDRGLTVTHTVMGTASYMAPEQAGGKTWKIGPAADIYALGAILYETLTGRPPFQAETRELTINRVLTEDPVAPTHWQPEVPPDLEAICLKCLEKEPGQRYASATGLAEELRRFREGKAITGPTGGEWRHARWAKRAGYEILDVLGASQLGIVYKARQVKLNRLVVLKTVSAKDQADPAKMARFHAEARAVARLQHPHIVHIYDFGEPSGQPYLSMEFLDGATLADQMVGQPWPVRQAAELVETLGRATHYAHQQGIVHSDLRPFNVQFTAGGVPKIVGFGLARLLESEGPESEGKGGPPVFSNYMAPEQAEGRMKDIGPATDVHALGAILYEMLTGQPPVFAPTVRETLEQVRFQEPVPPARLQRNVPPDLEAVCLKCLRKKPGDRYASAEALADDLKRFLAEFRLPEQPGSIWGRLVPWARRRKPGLE